MLGDAVLAIAVTLLALDINVPEGLPESDVAHAVREVFPAVGAYLLSFAVTGVLWLTRHALFTLIAEVDRSCSTCTSPCSRSWPRCPSRPSCSASTAGRPPRRPATRARSPCPSASCGR
ncbi:TMEM175 family protein [Streptomyces sp. NPDC059224]|uniref:TMEM175 family protein n=1 Tax=Streptomyces sp. NPDC059224 TaxID=3346775 RepID=UPI003674CAC8